MLKKRDPRVTNEQRRPAARMSFFERKAKLGEEDAMKRQVGKWV